MCVYIYIYKIKYQKVENCDTSVRTGHTGFGKCDLVLGWKVDPAWHYVAPRNLESSC